MDELHNYAFATTGMLIMRGFYDQSTVERMRKSVDSTIPQSLFIEKDPEIFMNFMSDTRITEYCSRYIGSWFRFDHELAVSQSTESKSYLHGGQFGSHGTCTHNPVGNYSWNGQLTVGLCLTAQDQDSGGFSYIPGSQHAIMGGQYGLQLEVWQKALEEIAVTPVLNPGDLYMFSEALVHGQRQWKGDGNRTTLYFKYVPGYMAWQNYEITQRYMALASTEVQKALLAPPYVRQGGFDSQVFRPSMRMLQNSK